jgi:hypothetical protein
MVFIWIAQQLEDFRLVIIAVCSENLQEHINTLYAQNPKCLNGKSDGKSSKDFVVKD